MSKRNEKTTIPRKLKSIKYFQKSPESISACRIRSILLGELECFRETFTVTKSPILLPSELPSSITPLNVCNLLILDIFVIELLASVKPF